MTGASANLSDQAARMRLAFDSAFAEATQRNVAPMEDLLGFQVDSEPYAIRLSEIGGLFAGRKITAVPGDTVALLGFAGLRGAIVPVYDLHVLLGRAASETPRWMATASGASAAFAFETFDGHLRVPRDAILAQQPDKQPQRLIREFVSSDGVSRPIVHLRSVLEAIEKLTPRAITGEER